MGHVLLRAARGERDEALALIDKDFLAHLWNDIQYTWFMAQSYALMGDVETGMRWLRRSVERGFIHYPFLSERDPLLENLRGHPDFATLMASVRREWETLEASIDQDSEGTHPVSS